METINAAGGYGPPGGGGGGGGWGPPGGGYGAPPGGGGYGAPPAPPAPPGGGYGAPPGGGYGSPPAGGFGGPSGFIPPGGPMMPGAGGDVNTTTPLLLNVIALLLCGATLISAPLSIIGIVFAIQAKNSKAAGDVLAARAKAKQSTIAFAVAMLVGVLFLAAWQFLLPAAPR